MTRLAVGLTAIVATLLPASALAQAPTDVEPTPSLDAPSPSAPIAEAKVEDTASDFEKSGTAWGFQITSALELTTFGVDPVTGNPTLVPVTVPMIGMRKWASPSHGFELGALFRIEKDTGLDANIFLGGAAGYLKTFTTHRHMRTFGELLGGIGLLMQGEDGLDDSLVLFARVAIGTEVRLGMVGLPHIGLTARIGAGLQVASVGDNTEITLGTEGGENMSVRGLLEGTVGFVFYL
ncbi:MAG: hypothetical protein SFX73_29680 [Kofleriaceae bacterium]|nr:hypothetical protein [Kofleriaceae bacterium]